MKRAFITVFLLAFVMACEGMIAPTALDWHLGPLITACAFAGAGDVKWAEVVS